MQWFKHDSNAHTDAKLRRVRMKYGLQGYGLYWYCLELIAQSVDAHNLTFELEHDAEIIAHDVGLSHELVQEMMVFMCNLGLFEMGDGGRVFCLKMLKRMDASMTSNPKLRDWIAQSKQNHDGVMIPSIGGPDGVMQERKKDKKDIGGDKSPKSQRFQIPTVDDVAAYAKERGYEIDAEAFHAHHATRGWKLKGGQAMKCWKAAVTTWAKNQERWGTKPAKGRRYV